MLLATLVMAGLLAACSAPLQKGGEESKVRAEEVWARPGMAMAESSGQEGMAGTTGVFLRLINEGDEADRLVGGKTDTAKAVEIHETVMDGEVMKMRMLPGGLEVPAGGQVELKPGSYHIMLIGLQRDLKPGDRFALELQFEKSGPLTVEPEVREP
jgi:hypothetical protein